MILQVEKINAPFPKRRTGDAISSADYEINITNIIDNVNSLRCYK